MAKRKKPAKEKPKTAEAEVKKKVERATMAEISQKHIDIMKTPWVLSSEDFDTFAYRRLYTGIVDLDVVLLPALGSRICIIGEESVGKTTTSHIFEAAAQRTCRRCFTPMLDWVHDETGEIIKRCKCGKNDPMVTVRIESENSFDPAWAETWGVDIGEHIDIRKGFKLRRNKADNFWVAMPTEGDAALTFAEDAILTGAADFIVVDSLAMLVPRDAMYNTDGTTRVVGDVRMSPLARLISAGMGRLTRAQIDAKLRFNARTTLLWTNQYYLGPVQNSYQDPRRPAGGKKAKYVESTVMRINRIDLEKGKGIGIDKASRYADIYFEVFKQKSGNIPKGQGVFRLHMADVQTKHGLVRAGQTDEADRLYAYLSDLGYYKAVPEGHQILGRTFKKVSDMRSYLLRPDINYMARYLILGEKISPSGRAYLYQEDYAYGPWGPPSFLKDIPEAAASGHEVPVPADGDRGETESPSWEDDLFPEEDGKQGEPEAG